MHRKEHLKALSSGNAFFVQILAHFMYNIGFHIVEFVENSRMKTMIHVAESDIGGLRIRI